MHNHSEQTEAIVNHGVDRNSADYKLGVCEAERKKVIAFLRRLTTALYSADFTEPLGQYRTELFYKEARALLDAAAHLEE